ncbi:MAG: peptidyl-prolyl cis-trans isomerase [Prolixibacteraceae bacterium]|nr:peptidyl-prolyl cis-trans isomerase [Prolixibacteraceae bacterium]
MEDFKQDNPQWNIKKSKLNKENQKKDWKEKYIEECYFLVDAVNNGHCCDNDLNSQLEIISNYILSKKDGILWNFLETPKLKFSKKDLRIAYQKRNTEYYIETLILNDTTQNYVIPKENLSNFFVENSIYDHSNENVQYQVFSVRYPFLKLINYTSLIDSLELESKKVIGPIYYDEYCLYFHMLKKEIIKQPSFKEEKDLILKELKQYKSTIIVKNNIENILNYSNPLYDENNIKYFLTLCRLNGKNRYSLDSVIKKLPAFPLVTYIHNGQLSEINSYQLSEHQIYSIISLTLKNKKSINRVLEDMIIQEYVSDSAKSLGLDTSKEFLLCKKYHKKRLIFDKYEKYLYDKFCNVNDSIIFNHYVNNKNEYTGSENAIVSLFYFDTFENAQRARGEIFRTIRNGYLKKLNSKDFLTGNIKYIQSDTVCRTDNRYPSELISNLFQLNTNVCTKPFRIEDKYIVAYKKSEDGLTIKSFDLVKDEIERKLRYEKYLEVKSDKIRELKEKYEMEINLIDKIKL